MNERLGKVIVPPKRVQTVIDAAYLFIRDWRRQTPGPNPYIEVKCFGEPPQRVYINPAFHYIEAKHAGEIARRYRFLPCVQELLSNSTDTPGRGGRGNLMLEGQAPPFKEKFVVCIEDNGEVAPGLYGHKLVNFYPRPK